MDPAPNSIETASASLSEAELAAARSEYRLLKRLLLAALWTSCALALSLNLADPDLWGHVQYGQDVLRDGSLHRTATYTYTAKDHPWINHENIAELTFATAYAWVGDEGLLVAKCILGMLILAAMAWVGNRHGVKAITMAAFLLLIANNLTAFFPVRPQLLSFACCSLMLLFLDKAFTGWYLWLGSSSSENEPTAPAGASVEWSPRNLLWLVGCVPIITFWTNSHGAFVAGICILSAYLGGRSVEAIVYKRRQAWRSVAIMTAVGLLAIAATVVNPYGLGLHHWLLASLGSPRPEITEWAAPKPSDPVFWPFVVLVVVAMLSWSLTKRRRDWVQIAIMVLVGWQACSHIRHIAFFTLLCGFWLAPHVQSAARRLRPPGSAKLPVQRLSTWWRWGFATALAMAIALQANSLYGRLSILPVHRNMYPVDAFQWMTYKGIHGRLVVSFNWAQYAIAALAPETTVAFDGRFRTCYPQSLVDMHFDFMLGENGGRRYRRPEAGPIDPTAILEFEKPDLVLVDRKYKHSVQVMEAEGAKVEPSWSLIYQDGIAQLWGRTPVYNDPNSPRYIAPEERLITDRIHRTAIAWPALPLQPVARELAERDSPQPNTENF